MKIMCILMKKEQYKGYLIWYYLFVWVLTSHSRIFHSFGYVTITGKGLQIFYILGTLAHWAVTILWRATANSIYNGLRGPWHSNLLPSVWHKLFLRLMSRLGFEHPTLCMRGKRFNLWLRHRCGRCIIISILIR